MAYNNKILSAIFGFSERTLYRRMKEKKVKRSDKDIISEAEARAISEKLGYINEFERHLQNGKKNQAQA